MANVWCPRRDSRPREWTTNMNAIPNTTDAARMEEIRKDASRYSTPAVALAAAKHCDKARWPILGDDGKVWLVRRRYDGVSGIAELLQRGARFYTALFGRNFRTKID